ncbi:DoxX family protein [Qipengyuania qiaonensis]|uniref:DoxX family protein n=1 Tax=Qipengyuania qiaonensis TaxID=2867240 RepID=A0ABS7J8N5_9SPHN|nr:DoxX family protein [Qipengyuania qiaonensis]MBX7482008.1 DoxX family protein [Qipengyuania qiaonensis]
MNEYDPEEPPNGKGGVVWAGRALTALFALFMLGASIAPKLLGLDVAGDTLEPLGWPRDAAFAIGILELACVALYLWPRTSVLGAILMTGVLGGAMATQFRVDAPLLSHSLFGIYLGLAMWGGLWLRDPALRRQFPWRVR